MSERASVRANDDVLGPVCRGEATTLVGAVAEMRLRFDETCKNSSNLELSIVRWQLHDDDETRAMRYKKAFSRSRETHGETRHRDIAS
jgi:hypothetical protein